MEKKTVGIIATVATAFLCGCPGLFGVCWGLIAAIASQVPGADIDIGGSSDPQTALYTGIAAFCGGVIFIAIPVLVGYFMLRKKPETQAFPGEPLPPAS